MAAQWQAEQAAEQQRLEQRSREQKEAWQRAEDARRARVESLTARFGPEATEKIQAGKIWVGQTKDMLVEAVGRPADVEEKVLKTKTKHVFKYQRQGANRYALRVTLDDGVVVGWDQK